MKRRIAQFALPKMVERIGLATLFLGVLLYASYVFAMSSGMTGVTRKNGNGCDCHSPFASSSVTVTINGPADLSPGQTGNYTVTVQGGPAVRAGTDIASSAGVLNPASGSLQKVGDELTHVSPQPFSGGVATFPFTFTAPSTPGNYTIYANGNSVNFNGSNTGDQWNFAPDKVVTVKATSSVDASSGVPKDFALSQNYPNPFNPSTNISFDVARKALVALEVFEISGKRIATLVDDVREPGSYKVSFNSHGLPSGVYFTTLRVDGAVVQTRKMTLVK